MLGEGLSDGHLNVSLQRYAHVAHTRACSCMHRHRPHNQTTPHSSVAQQEDTRAQPPSTAGSTARRNAYTATEHRQGGHGVHFMPWKFGTSLIASRNSSALAARDPPSQYGLRRNNKETTSHTQHTAHRPQHTNHSAQITAHTPQHTHHSTQSTAHSTHSTHHTPQTTDHRQCTLDTRERGWGCRTVYSSRRRQLLSALAVVGACNVLERVPDAHAHTGTATVHAMHSQGGPP